jgi:hypothetical protein
MADPVDPVALERRRASSSVCDDGSASRSSLRSRRIKAANDALLAQGIHPATGLRLADGDRTCGSCVHLLLQPGVAGRYYKCELHRLGASRSEASDVRKKWPACTAWVEATE